jgi:hypothetical protein
LCKGACGKPQIFIHNQRIVVGMRLPWHVGIAALDSAEVQGSASAADDESVQEGAASGTPSYCAAGYSELTAEFG